jgi:hypothetical protein
MMSSLPRVLGLTLFALFALSACGDDDQGNNPDPDQVDSASVPELGACRMLAPDDVDEASNATTIVECTEPHTAQTYAVGPLPTELRDADYDDDEVGRFAYQTCADKFERFLGADESMVLRSIVSWAWFRPSEKAWEDGARWYRCDIIGGSEQSEDFVTLPENAQGLLQGQLNDKWLICADGASVSDSVKVPCTEEHQWRAVTTIKLGEASDPYPGDRVVEVTTRDYCSDSVGAWLSYPVDYEYGYTWFHQAEWEAGNRRSVCWAKTPE